MTATKTLVLLNKRGITSPHPLQETEKKNAQAPMVE